MQENWSEFKSPERKPGKFLIGAWRRSRCPAQNLKSWKKDRSKSGPRKETWNSRSDRDSSFRTTSAQLKWRSRTTKVSATAAGHALLNRDAATMHRHLIGHLLENRFWDRQASPGVNSSMVQFKRWYGSPSEAGLLNHCCDPYLFLVFKLREGHLVLSRSGPSTGTATLEDKCSPKYLW
jgi:hypothetical protein